MWRLFGTPVHATLLSQQHTQSICYSKQNTMQHVTVEDVIVSFPHPILNELHLG
jgi:5,10-methylene-tetrahydrofolate dehydrogenase/methenyl tetrahydrofolate cyclohydrolase